VLDSVAHPIGRNQAARAEVIAANAWTNASRPSPPPRPRERSARADDSFASGRRRAEQHPAHRGAASRRIHFVAQARCHALSLGRRCPFYAGNSDFLGQVEQGEHDRVLEDRGAAIPAGVGAKIWRVCSA